MKTIFFVIPTLYRINIILRTDIFQYLKRKGNVRLVIFSPFSEDPEFKKEFSGENILLEKLEKTRESKLLTNLRFKLLKVDHPDLLHALNIMRSLDEEKVVTKPTLSNQAMIAFRKIISPLRPLIIYLFNKADEVLLKDSKYLELFGKYKPSAVVVGTIQSDLHDISFLAHARRNKVASIAVDLPWNYFENRMFTEPRPITKAIVWNKIMQGDFIKRYGIKNTVPVVTGTARYDHYRNMNTEPREDFFKRIGADTQKKLITFAMGGDDWHPYQFGIVEMIMERLDRPFQMLVRFGPRQKAGKRYLDLAQRYPNLMVEESEKHSHKDYLTNLLYHSDIILSHFSSLAPHIYFGFVGKDPKHPFNAVLEYIFEFDFVKKPILTGGISVALSEDRLIEQINAYLDTPSLDRKGRKRLVREFLGEIDGKAGERIAKEILEL